MCKYFGNKLENKNTTIQSYVSFEKYHMLGDILTECYSINSVKN